MAEKYSDKVGFVYIDGDHRASAVYLDAVNSFKLSKVGGYILFDDYVWSASGVPAYEGDPCRPQIGIDKFLHEYAGSYELIKKDQQVLVRKTKNHKLAKFGSLNLLILTILGIPHFDKVLCLPA